MRLKSIFIFDPEEEPTARATPRDLIRPQEPHIIQLEQPDCAVVTEFSISLSPENEPAILEFTDHQQFERKVEFLIRKYLRENNFGRFNNADLDFHVMDLSNRGLALMANFRIANVDLKELSTYAVDVEEELERIRREGMTVLPEAS